MTAPYYSDDHVTLWHGDWRELIAPDYADAECACGYERDDTEEDA